MATSEAVVNVTLTTDDIKRIAREMIDAPLLPHITNENIASYYVGIDNGGDNPPITASMTTTTGDGTGITHWIYPDTGTITFPDPGTIGPLHPWQPTEVVEWPNQWINPPIDNIPTLVNRIQELENKITMLEAVIREHIDRTKPLIEEERKRRSLIIEEDE